MTSVDRVGQHLEVTNGRMPYVCAKKSCLSASQQTTFTISASLCHPKWTIFAVLPSLRHPKSKMSLHAKTPLKSDKYKKVPAAQLYLQSTHMTRNIRPLEKGLSFLNTRCTYYIPQVQFEMVL